MTLENGNYSKIKKDFDAEALKENGMFSKELTECDRLSIEYLQKIVKPEMKVLEIGCGMGNVIESLDCEQYGLDLSPEMIKHCKLKNKEVGNMDELPYPVYHFDLIFMIMTLQQSVNQNKTVNHIKRFLKKGGQLIIIDGDRTSPIGVTRELKLGKGEWETCGDAQWISAEDFPDFESEHLAPHILLLKKRK